MNKMFIILSVSNSYSLLSVIVISFCSLVAGFLIKLVKYAVAKKRILHLEDEMLSNHARILKLQKKISDFQSENPASAQTVNVSPETVAREKAIVVEQIKQDPKMAGKPDEMIAKIAEGKLNAFFKEHTLLAQMYVKDGSKTVAEFLKTVDADVKVVEFKRVALG